MKQIELALLVTLLVWNSPAAADVHVVAEFSRKTTMGRQPAKSEKGIHHIWLKKDRVAKKNHRKLTEITRFDLQLQYRLDPAAMTYSKRTHADIMQQAEGRTRALAEDLSETYSVKLMEDSEKDAQILGYKTQRYIIERNSKKFIEVWASEELDPTNSFGKMVLLSAPPDKKTRQQLGQVKGVWLKWKLTIDSGRLSITEQATAVKISTEPVDDKTFDIPKGFRMTNRSADRPRKPSRRNDR